MSALFIPLTKLTPLNATQYLSIDYKNLKLDENLYFDGAIQDIMKAEQMSYIQVSSMIAEPFSVLKMLPRTLHRGISNPEDYDRVLFFVHVDRELIDIKEKSVYSDSQYGK
jgi:hypothetical protein